MSAPRNMILCPVSPPARAERVEIKGFCPSTSLIMSPPARAERVEILAHRLNDFTLRVSARTGGEG